MQLPRAQCGANQELVIAVQQIIRESEEGGRVFAERLDGGAGGDGKALGLGAGTVEAEDGGVRGLLGSNVFAGAFAELFARLGDVEDIVDDLEGEAEGLTEIGEGLQFRLCRIGAHGAEPDGGSQKGSGFGLMDELEIPGGGGFAFALEVEYLAGNEPQAAGGSGELADEGGHVISAGGGSVAEDLEGDGKEGIAGEDGDAFAEDLMIGRPAAAEVIVIHAGEIVVDERVGVDAFDGTGVGQGGVDGAAAGLRGCEGEDGAKTLAARKEAVAHRLVESGGFDGGLREETAKRLIHQRRALREILIQKHVGEALCEEGAGFSMGKVAIHMRVQVGGFPAEEFSRFGTRFALPKGTSFYGFAAKYASAGNRGGGIEFSTA